jgi:hypothetical protein
VTRSAFVGQRRIALAAFPGEPRVLPPQRVGLLLCTAIAMTNAGAAVATTRPVAVSPIVRCTSRPRAPATAVATKPDDQDDDGTEKLGQVVHEKRERTLQTVESTR